MRVTVVRGGGLAGTVLTVSVDTADLDDAAAAALRERVAAATLRDRPRTGRPDGRRVEVTVDDDGSETRARFDEHDAPSGAGALLGWVLDCPAATRSPG